MPNKHFCQGPRCHEQVTQDRFLKSRGVIRGRYAYYNRDVSNDHYYGTTADKYFCSQQCKFTWLSVNMENIEHGRPIEFIRHRRESQGYAKVKNDESEVGSRIFYSKGVTIWTMAHGSGIWYHESLTNKEKYDRTKDT